MRGKLIAAFVYSSFFRITPAGAGKTLRRFRQSRQHRDHPRRCGENRYVPDRRQRGIGSPPQVRGKRHHLYPCPQKNGITPAGAGKTLRRFRQSRQHRDHPRRCGENDLPYFVSFHFLGSPPQVRGKQFCSFQNLVDNGITPAGAGKTMAEIDSRCGRWDHPRRCGENDGRRICTKFDKGSPPQVRGKPALDDTAHIAVRITPAGAGKTLALAAALQAS